MLREKIKKEALKQGFQNEKEKINIYQLAKASGLQQTQLKNYLNGSNDLQGENIEKLFKVLNIGLCCV
jgi:transcriptional regulator with XRE-family HTH domain